MQAFGPAEGDDARMKALNFILEAWEEGTGSGIAPELMAYAALYTALTDLVASFGEDFGRLPGERPGAARAEGRVHALPLAPVAPATRGASRRCAHQKRSRLTTISPIRTQPKPISTRPAMRLICPSRTTSRRWRMVAMNCDTTNQ